MRELRVSWHHSRLTAIWERVPVLNGSGPASREMMLALRSEEREERREWEEEEEREKQGGA